MSKLVLVFIITVLLGSGTGFLFSRPSLSDVSNLIVHADAGWRADWALQPGFTLEIDTQGFQFPTAIAFVPNPGKEPDDPLYFVTELRGTVRVVTNDRTIYTFADGLFDPRDSLETGLGAVCLDPANGYVFVTFASPDESGVLRNNIIRFQSTPRTFSLSPESRIAFYDIFSSFRSGGEHQIGHCSVEDDILYVSVGDGSQITQSQQTDSVLGKVLRMKIDGDPLPDNPYFEESKGDDSQNFVWAMGLRNPFGLEMVDGRLFVADNGPSVDRFLEVTKGVNYLWDGSGSSFGANADYLISPGYGMAQLTYYSGESPILPDEFDGNFFITVTGNPAIPTRGAPAIKAVPYDLRQNKVSSVPSYFLSHRSPELQLVAGVDIGPDGLYFSTMFPNNDGITAIFKIRSTPESDHPFLLNEELNPIVLMNSRGCFSCHTLNNNGGGATGPLLDRDQLLPRVLGRLNSEAYKKKLIELSKSDDEILVKYREVREAIGRAEGLDKVDLWLSSRIQQPRFDDPDAIMPNLGITSEQADRIASYLSGSARLTDERTANDARSAGEDQESTWDFVKGLFPDPTRANASRYITVIFSAGLVMGILVGLATLWFLSRRNRPSRRDSF